MKIKSMAFFVSIVFFICAQPMFATDTTIYLEKDCSALAEVEDLGYSEKREISMPWPDNCTLKIVWTDLSFFLL